MSLQLILSLLTTTSLIAGGIFAAVQLLHLRKQRKRDSALQMLNSVQTPEFMEAIGIIYDLPDGLSKKEIEAQLGSRTTSILIMFVKFEAIGLLVFKREMDLLLVKDFIGGPVLIFWRTMKNYFLETRAKEGKQNYGEWIQWLAEQLEKLETKKPKVPAHVAHKDWKA